MLTYKKWIKAVVAYRMREHSCTKKDAKFGLDYDSYWTQYVIPSLNRGDHLTLPVCRSIVKNHPVPVLGWIWKTYPGQMPSVYFDTGRACKDGQSKPTEPEREWTSAELFVH